MGVREDDVMAEGRYLKSDSEFGEKNAGELVIWTVGKHMEEEKVYTYDEAINLTGNGWYNITLLVTLAIAIQAMALDMFGFSIVVSAASCDLQLDHSQTSILLSIPLLGAIIMAYPWGYITDTQGRKKSLLMSLCGSFVLASLTAFSPNWITLAVLKFFASSLSSGIQSMAYTLLGESCCVRTKSSYLIVLTSALMMGLAVFYAHGYVVLSLHFAFDLGFIVFKPWRLLVLTLSFTLGCSAILVSFFYESPKFLVNAGRTEEAVDALRKIKKRNRLKGIYPVKNVILTESSSLRRKDLSLMESLWSQTVPLFKAPHLQNTLLLFYITAVVYCVNNGFFLWIPVIVESFFEDVSTSDKNLTKGFCDLMSSRALDDVSDDCSSVVTLESLLTGIVQGLVFIVINLAMSRLAHVRKVVLICVLCFSSLCCFAMLFFKEKYTTIILFFGVIINCLGMGVIFTYFVELYPTSYRGMASCLGILVARSSALIGVNLVGAFIFTHCCNSLYIWGAYMFSGALMCFLLPPDK